MSRFIPFLVVLALATIVSAQTGFNAASQPSPSALEQPSAANNYGIPPAPKPGHPLDPNDVAILTGKADNYSAPTQQPYVTPQIYYSLPLGGSQFGNTRFGTAQGWDSSFVGFGRRRGFGNQFGFGDNLSWGRQGWGMASYYDYGNLNGSQFADVTTSSFDHRNRYSGYSFSGSQFADVTTATGPSGFTGRRKPGHAPNVFFGNTVPGSGFNSWRPHYWNNGATAPHRTAVTAPMFSPSRRP